MKTTNFPEKQNARRKRVIIRLEEQLKKGTKPVKGEPKDVFVLLSDTDIRRIKGEIETLKKSVH